MKGIAITLLLVSAVAGLMTPAAGAEMNGKEVFEHYCAYCHGSSEGPGTMQLSRTRGKGKGLLTQRTDLAPEYIQYIVRHGLRSMPPFVPSDVTDAKLEALVTFLTRQPAVGK